MPLFRSKIDPRCAYCRYGTALIGRDEVGCVRHGIMSASGRCRRFRYDPFKRVPPKPASLKRKYVDADFRI